MVEATAGNTGLGLALVARIKGYRVVLVVPDKMAVEKILHLKALGAEIHLTRSDVGKGHPEYYQDYAARLAREIPGAWFADQFNNPANPRAHETTTGPELWDQVGHELDAIVVGVGSSGTLTGLSRYFRRVQPELEFVLADPKGSILADYINTGVLRTDAGSWAVEGIGEDFIPGIADLSRVQQRLHHQRRGKLPHRAPAAARGRHPGRLVERHAAGRRAALLPRADHAQARGHLRVRHRHALPDQGVQRRLDGRPGPAAAPHAGRPARPDRAPLSTTATWSPWRRPTRC